jgi:hypothetical protein
MQYYKFNFNIIETSSNLQSGGNDNKYSELYFALKRLGFSKPKQIQDYLINFSGFGSGKYGNETMYGGGRAETIKFIDLYFNYTETSDRYIYSYGGDRECIVMEIPKDNEKKECHIEKIDANGECKIDSVYTKKGSFLIKLAMSFIQQKLKKKHNLEIITLMDNSNKLCRSGGITISMADMYFLLNGNTWYGSFSHSERCLNNVHYGKKSPGTDHSKNDCPYGKYNFRPCDRYKGGLDVERNKKYIKNQKIIGVAKVKHVEKELRYFMIKYNEGKMSDAEINKIIDVNMNTLLSTFLKYILREYDANCYMFYKMYQPIMEKLGMVTFRNTSFFRPV